MQTLHSLHYIPPMKPSYHNHHLLLLLFFFLTNSAMCSYNVMDFGAIPDGEKDSVGAFLGAWQAVCASEKPGSMSVPGGRYLLSHAVFSGPCNNSAIRVFIEGVIVAPFGYSGGKEWVSFKYVDGVSINGGTFDGQGQAFWACKNSSRRCPAGATSLTIGHSKNVVINGVKLIDSEFFHMGIFASTAVTVQGVNITAPEESPNTDGIHVHMSGNITVTDSSMHTGDDCISIGAGTTNVLIQRINCGPGHGISIGSLGGGITDDAGVKNITVRNITFSGSQNGIRIKTWAKPNSGFVTDVVFQHITMNAVDNPILVDQYYCPGSRNCPNMTSGIAITNVSYTDITGTSTTPVAVKFDCSPTRPCNGISLQDVLLLYENRPALSFCRNVNGTVAGYVVPESCLN